MAQHGGASMEALPEDGQLRAFAPLTAAHRGLVFGPLPRQEQVRRFPDGLPTGSARMLLLRDGRHPTCLSSGAPSGVCWLDRSQFSGAQREAYMLPDMTCSVRPSDGINAVHVHSAQEAEPCAKRATQGGDAALRLQRILASIHTITCAHPAASPLAASAPQLPAGHMQEEEAAAGELHRAVVRLYAEAEPPAPVLAPPGRRDGPALLEALGDDLGNRATVADPPAAAWGGAEEQAGAGVAGGQGPAGVLANGGDTDMAQAQGEDEDDEVCCFPSCFPLSVATLFLGFSRLSACCTLEKSRKYQPLVAPLLDSPGGGGGPSPVLPTV